MPYDPEDKETKAAIAIVVKDAVTAATEEAVEGLKNKNKELLTKLKKAQKNSEIDPAEHAALETELEESQAALVVANKALKKATTEADKYKADHETAANTNYQLLVDNGLSAALLAVGVKNAAYQKAAKALLSKEKFTFEGEGADRVAKVGDKTLTDFVKDWAGGDEGKAFVSAKENLGTGALGGKGKLDANTISEIKDPGSRLGVINEQEAAGAE